MSNYLWRRWRSSTSPMRCLSHATETKHWIISIAAENTEPDPARTPPVGLFDLKPTKVDGLDVLKQLKSDEKVRMIPVVLLTSSKEEKDMVASYKLGVNAYVVKPVDFHEFCECNQRIGRLLGRDQRAAPGERREVKIVGK